MLGAIAGGNTVILKPSELSPNTAAVMQKIMGEALDPDCFTCVQGAIPQMQALLAEQWDKIFFTGSVNTAKVVAKAAAVHLTPTVYELGGKNPAIVTKKANPHLAARRLLWGKTMNAGQVCISQNYILVDKEVLPVLVAELKTAYKEFFPDGAKKSEDYARIVNLRSFQRLKGMLDNSSGKIVLGGEMDAEQLFIEPTVVEVSDVNDSLLAQESFGPLIPILPVDNLDEAISIANSIHATPLGSYVFGDKKEAAKVLSETRSGGLTINDALFHAIIPTVEFGGVGDSGMGSYRGKASFDTFVHRRVVAQTPGWMEKMLAVRYPPYTGTSKYKQLSSMGTAKPNFDKDGNERVNMLWYLLTLGGKSLTQGVVRALLVASVAVGLRSVATRRGDV
jgi:beta-apo-4'-carotenal oxygenase